MNKPFLSTDKRLNIKMARIYGAIDIYDVFRELRKSTGIKFSTSDPEIQTHQYTIGFRSGTARSYMDGIAALYESGWDHSDKKGYELISYDPYLDDDSQIDKNSAFGIVIKTGEALLSGLDDLSELKKQKLFGIEGLTTNELPTSTYKEMIRAFQADADKTSKGLPPGFTTPDPKQIKPSDIKIRLERRNDSKFPKFNMIYSSNYNGNPGFSGRVPVVDKKSRRESVSKNNAPYYPTRRFSYPKKDAMQRPDMKRKISLNLGRVKLTDVCNALHKLYEPGVVSEVRRYLPDVKQVSIPESSFSDVLSRLEVIFPETQWEVRESGMLVLRGPQNSARTRRSVQSDL